MSQEDNTGVPPARLAARKEPDGSYCGSVQVVPADWCDYNGHMNVAFYVRLFDLALDELFVAFDMSEDYIKREAKSHFTIEAHIDYTHEVHQGQRVFVRYRITDVSPKVIAFHATMHSQEAPDTVHAVWEQLTLSVDMVARRACAMPEELYEQLRASIVPHFDGVKAGRVSIRKK